MNTKIIYKILPVLFILIAFFSCDHGEQDLSQLPDPDPIITELEYLITDYDGNGLIPGEWNTTNDGTEMTICERAANPDKEKSDSVLHMAGKDENENWWVGTSLGGNPSGDAPFGLPADGSKVRLAFDIYAVNGNANIEIQLQETDGDVFSWNLGANGGFTPPTGEWTTYTTDPFDEIAIGYQANGDNKLAPELLANVSLALISGNSPGNNTELYLNNIRFIVTEQSHVATPTNLSAKTISQTTIQLKWDDNAINETNYFVERAIGNGNYEIMDTLPADSFIYTDTTLTASTTYSYRVFAMYGNKQSKYSNTVSATTSPRAVISLLISDFNEDEKGLIQSSVWTEQSDNAELETFEFVANPLGDASDIVLHLVGTDTDADWWIGSALGGNDKGETKFGLPADISLVSVRFDFYAGNATANLDIQLQEADGDAFVWNFGGNGGYGSPTAGWKTYTVSLVDFVLSDWARAGDNELHPELLSNVSFALISGNSQGNSANAYINNVRFIYSE